MKHGQTRLALYTSSAPCDKQQTGNQRISQALSKKRTSAVTMVVSLVVADSIVKQTGREQHGWKTDEPKKRIEDV